MKKADFTAKVITNRLISSNFYRLTVITDIRGTEVFADCVPGKFLELDVSNLAVPAEDNIDKSLIEGSEKQILLRRPFSFSDIRKTNAGVEIEILYGVVGPGTLRMTTLKEGDTVGIIGPLGNGFTIPENVQTALLIGGGTGTPPMQHLAKYLKRNYSQIHTTVFIGARSIDDIPTIVGENANKEYFMTDFADMEIDSVIATDDGSAGFDGLVTEAVRKYIEENKPAAESTVIYACGPEPMLKAAAKLAQECSLESQLSTDRIMACGFGLCQSCAVEVKSDNPEGFEYKLCCKDGPVFDGKKLVF